MKRRDFCYLTAIIFLYIFVLFVGKKHVFGYTFSRNLLQNYFLSQDIPTEVPGKRLFLSDGEIHIAAGYLYASGVDPTSFNFQHPPFIKYLYGASILLTGNPFYIQILFGMMFLVSTYILSLEVFKKSIGGFLSCLFLIFDPLFINLSSDTLLDLGQGTLLLIYLLLLLYKPKHFFLQGITLGLLSASKFWGAIPFFVLAISIYLLKQKNFYLKNYLLHLGIASLFFTLFYAKAFIEQGGKFNIVFFELKTVKYWMNHSVASIYGSSLFLYLTGFMKSWWGDKSIIREQTWTILWPVTFIASLLVTVNQIFQKKFSGEFLIAVIPISYLLYLGFQAPFARYFILILPFSYIILSKGIISLVRYGLNLFK